MITFNNIVERFKVFAENHFFVKSFSFGSPDDVDLTKFTNFPLMHLVYTGANYDAGTKTYNLEVYILDVPSDKTKKVDRQKEVVSDAEQCAEDIIADIKNGGNIFLFAQDYEVVNATTTPLEEETKNVLSGVLLDLSVAIPYEWDACNAPIDGVEPGGTEVTYARRGILRMLTIDGATDVPSVRTIKVTNGTLTDDGDGVVTLDTGGVDRLSQLEDTNIVTPSDREALIYDGGQWVNDTLGKGDVGLANVNNTSDADKPVSTATQTALDAKADTSAVPTELNDLSDVTISGTPTGNQALIYDATASVFKSTDSFTNRFEDDVERGSGNITPFVERAYGVKSDGDGIFIDNQSDTPSAGKVIKRKIYHKAGIITDTDVIGDYTLIHTFDDDTAYSATESTFEGFRDGDTYGTPPFTLIQTWEEEDAAPAFTGLLNESYGSGAEAAYSTRRLNGNYSGDCMTIRRASDGTTQSIGFVGEEIDESAIETFCSGTTCTVQVWRDQSGNGNNATQTDPTKQPTIYTGGALVKEGGRLALDFDSNDHFTTPSMTLNEVGFFIMAKSAYSAPTGYFGDYSGSNNFVGYTGTAYRIRPLQVDMTGSIEANKNNLISIHATLSNASAVYESGTLLASAGNANPATTLTTVSAYQIGGNTWSFVGRSQEFIIYDADKSSVRTDIEENIGDYYTQNTPLLDTYSGAAAAYSLRKLRTAYTGNAIRVRRSNDNAETDIGFNVFGELDTVSLAAHCGSNDGFVKTWYDQASTNDATQTNTANQPKIYDGSTGVVTENGKPKLDFVIGSKMSTSLTLNNDPLFITAVAKSNTFRPSVVDVGPSAYNKFSLELWVLSGVGRRFALFYGDGLNYDAILLDNNNINEAIITAFKLNDSAKLFANGVELGASSFDYDSSGVLGFQNRGNNSAMLLGEVIVYSSDQSSNRTNIEDNINTFYDIY